MLNITQDSADPALVKRRKSALLKGFKATQSKKIESANILAVYLILLGKISEAHGLLKSYAEEIPYVEHRWERWEAACKAILLLSYIEHSKGNREESERLNLIVLSQDYEYPDENKQELLWEYVKGYHSTCSLIAENSEEISKAEEMQMYAENFQCFIYFAQLHSSFSGFSEADVLVIQSSLTEITNKLRSNIR